MQPFRIFSLSLIAAGLWLASAGYSCAATVTVTYTHPENYTDMPDSPAKKKQVLADLKKHLTELGARLPLEQDLKLEITDIDLAGRIDLGARHPSDIRILKDRADWPKMHVRYLLEANGKVIQSGEELIWDDNYLQQDNAYPGADSLRYEKKMLDNWFSKKFSAALH